MAPKTNKVVNWTKSNMSALVLDDLVTQGLLPAQEEIEWRVPKEETHPQPQESEVIVFADRSGARVLVLFNLMCAAFGKQKSYSYARVFLLESYEL